MANVARPCSTAATIVAKLSSSSTRSAASARHVAAARPHGDADVGLAQRGAVVDAVAGHRDHVPARPERPGDSELVLRGHPGDHHAVAIHEGSQHLFVGGELCTGQHESVVRSQTRLVGNGSSGERGVAGDHRDVDPGAPARGERVAGLGSRGVLEGEQAEQLEVGLGLVGGRRQRDR